MLKRIRHEIQAEYVHSHNLIHAPNTQGVFPVYNNEWPPDRPKSSTKNYKIEEEEITLVLPRIHSLK